MKPLQLKRPTYLSMKIVVLGIAFVRFMSMHATAQTNIKVTPAGKAQTISFHYSKDVFYISPAVIADELVWLDKMNGNNTYADQVTYLRHCRDLIIFKEGQKEFRNITEEKLFKTVQLFLPRLIVQSKASHYDMITKKPSTVLIITFCEDKSPSYVGISTQKGRIILDCVTK